MPHGYPDYQHATRITAQEIEELYILAPSAKAVNIAYTTTHEITEGTLDIDPGTTKTLVEISARGRMIRLWGNIEHARLGDEVRLNLDVDGYVVWTDTFEELLRHGGGQLYMRTYVEAPAAGYYYAQSVGKEGGIYAVYWDGSRITRAVFDIVFDIEFYSFCRIRVQNMDPTNASSGRYWVKYGVYI